MPTPFETSERWTIGLELLGAGAEVVVGFIELVEFSFGFCGRPSSFRHIGHLDVSFLSLKSPIEAGSLVRLQKEQILQHLCHVKGNARFFHKIL